MSGTSPARENEGTKAKNGATAEEEEVNSRDLNNPANDQEVNYPFHQLS